MTLLFLLELLSLVLGVFFIVLAIIEQPSAWIFGLLSSLCLLIIYINAGFIFNSALMAYYIVIAVYGFMTWTRTKADGAYVVSIKHLSIKQNGVMIIIGSVLASLFFLMIKDIGTSPLLDALIFSFSMLATFLQVKKYIDNWFYWIALNALSAIMMGLSGLYLLTLLMLFYLLMACIGYHAWKKNIEELLNKIETH